MSTESSGNQLSKAASSYLRSAAHQPVDWREWNSEAFALAQAQNKPILLDIGAVWCHWCHVMDRESYENADVARLINESFIAVKVDRDERPDIDSRYQVAVSALTGANEDQTMGIKILARAIEEPLRSQHKRNHGLAPVQRLPFSIQHA